MTRHFVVHVFEEDSNGMVEEGIEMLLLKTKTDNVIIGKFKLDISGMEKLEVRTYSHYYGLDSLLQEEQGCSNFTVLRIK